MTHFLSFQSLLPISFKSQNLAPLSSPNSSLFHLGSRQISDLNLNRSLQSSKLARIDYQEMEIVQVAVETLRDLLIEEAKFSSGVSDQVEEVERDLKTIHCLLKDVDPRPGRYSSASIGNCVAELKDVAVRAEIVLEKYAVDVTSKRRHDITLKEKLKRYACILRECLNVHQVGKETEAIRSRVAKLANSLESMSKSTGEGSLSSTSANNEDLLRQRYAHEVEQHFVGMEKDIKHLVSLVKLDNDERSVISICGMGGLGKTTLARKIYHHRDLQASFEARAWVCISQQFQPETVLQEILMQILPGETESIKKITNLRDLVVKLYHVQTQKKCFVVIDDIWERKHWEILMPAFPIAEANSRLLLTTRNENIASQQLILYKLDFLTEDQGWELLRKIALPEVYLSQGPRPDLTQLEAIGRKMVQKCGRLPLAISVIGGILRHKQTWGEWENVSNNMDAYLKHGEGVGEDKRVAQVLDLSYNVLPYYLRPCFLYLGCFKEDEEIYTDKLYLLWMAEGLIAVEEKGRNETLRDVAQRYLNELALRCMVQVRGDDTLKTKFSTVYNKFTSCRLHDLMRDLCLRKGEEEGFIKVMDLGQEGKTPSNINSAAANNNNNIRRLAILGNSEVHEKYILSHDLKLKAPLRSLLISRRYRGIRISPSDDGRTSISRITNDFNKIKFLKTLKLENCEFEDGKLPSEVGKLIHLKYLSLLGSDVKELPLSVCYLPYLQTLDLRVMWRITLPNAILNLKRLRHLFLTYSTYTMKEGVLLTLDGLNELETVSRLYSDTNRTVHLRRLRNLQLLDIMVCDYETLSFVVDEMMEKLREIYLCISVGDLHNKGEDIVLGILRKMFMSRSLIELGIQVRIGFNFPCHQPRMCPNLVELRLFDCEFEGDVVQVLGNFPMLKYLLLGTNAFIGTEMICHATAFPQLKCLILDGLRNLEKWKVEEGAMPNLSRLEIIGCTKLEMIPDGLRFITTLQELRTQWMPKEFFDRLRVVNGEAGQDYHKVHHIRSIELLDYGI